MILLRFMTHCRCTRGSGHLDRAKRGKRNRVSGGVWGKMTTNDFLIFCAPGGVCLSTYADGLNDIGYHLLHDGSFLLVVVFIV